MPCLKCLEPVLVVWLCNTAVANTQMPQRMQHAAPLTASCDHICHMAITGNNNAQVISCAFLCTAEQYWLVYVQDTGAVLSSWGKNQFLMPHGLSVDLEGNIWVTDCGLHQALKFDPKGNQLLALGTRLEPGSDSTHLCKPTHVRCLSTDAMLVKPTLAATRHHTSCHSMYVRAFVSCQSSHAIGQSHHL